MYVDTAYSLQGGKSYRRYLLRESFREDGKVKHQTLANLSHCSEEEIAALKLALRHKGDPTELICVFRSKSAGVSEQIGHPDGLNRPP